MRPFYLLDTNTVSYLINGRSSGVREGYRAAENEGARIAISAITEAEAWFGFERRPEALRLRRNWERFLGSVEVLVWESGAARVYGRLRAELERVGQGVGSLDLLIAAHAVSVGAVLVTHDLVLLRVGGVIVVDWASD